MLVENCEFKASRAGFCCLPRRPAFHNYVTDPHHVGAGSPLRVLASWSCHDDVGSARTPPRKSCPFQWDLDGHPWLVVGRDFDADRILGRDVRIPSDQQPPHRRVDDKGQLDGLVQVASDFLSDIEREGASLHDHHAVGLDHPTRPTQGHRAQAKRMEVAGRESTPYRIASPWKLLDRLRIVGIDSQRRSHQSRQYAKSWRAGKIKRWPINSGPFGD